MCSTQPCVVPTGDDYYDEIYYYNTGYYDESPVDVAYCNLGYGKPDKQDFNLDPYSSRYIFCLVYLSIYLITSILYFSMLFDTLIGFQSLILSAFDRPLSPVKCRQSLDEQVPNESDEDDSTEEVFELELDWTPVGKETVPSPVEPRKDSYVAVYDVAVKQVILQF